MKNKDKQNEQKTNNNKGLIILVLLVIIILLIWVIAYLATGSSNNSSITASESKNSSTESTTESAELPDCCTVDANGNTVSSGDAQSSNEEDSSTKLDDTHNKGYTKEQSREYLEDAIDYTMQLDDIQIDVYDDINNTKTIYLLKNGYIYENGESTGAKVLTSDILTDAVPVIEQLKDAEYFISVDEYDLYMAKIDNVRYQINTSNNNDGQKFVKCIFRFIGPDDTSFDTDLTVDIRDKSDFPD